MAMAGESPGASTSFLGLLSFRRNQIVSLEPTPQDELDSLEHFQLEVTSRLVSLLSSDDSSSFLSLSFLSKLLDSLLCTDHEFRSLLPVLLSRNPSILSKPPSDKHANDLLDRAVKSLDLCNAVSLSLQAMRHSHRQARIAASCLLQSDHIGEAQMSRARRALKKLLGGAFNRTGSSGRGGGSSGSGSSIARDMHNNSKSLSFSVSRNWSARQQVQAMAAHLAAPRQVTVTDTASGLAMAVYTMSSLLVFVMWVLVSAVPCHDRLSTNGTTNATAPPPPPPRHLQWAAPMMTLQDKITEEWKRKDKKTSGGLLAEMQTVENSARWLMEWVEEGVKEGGPLIEEDRTTEVTARASELEEACELLEEGLEPFERQVRAVFHRVVSSRAEVIRYLDDSVRSAKAHGHGNAGHSPLHGAGLPPMP